MTAAVHDTRGDRLGNVGLQTLYNNEHYGVLIIACICSLESLKETCAREIDFEYTESVFIKNLSWSENMDLTWKPT